MAICAKCGMKIGGMDRNPADKNELAICKAHGIDVPEPICYECFRPLSIEAEKIQHGGMTAAQAKYQTILHLPVVTLHAIEGRKYTPLGIASAHVAIGTGVLSQLFSGVSDFFGAKSDTYSQKMREAEQACLSKIRTNAVEMGADAVLGTQTTYTELTSGHGMLLVCMTGTAVKFD